MGEGNVEVYYGTGRGKSSAALGNAIRAAGRGEAVGIIQFLKVPENKEYLARLEPEIKIFRFERSAAGFDDMTDEEKQEEKQNITNGLNYAKKVLSTEEFDLLVLDEVLGVVVEGMADVGAILELVEARPDATKLILTGRSVPDEIRAVADEVVNLVAE